MKEINILTTELREKLLEFLYKEEIYNAFLIELLENDLASLGELYINETGENIREILHIKNDGNSNFTNFAYSSVAGLNGIASQIKKLNYPKILLAGKLQEVNNVLQILGQNKQSVPNILYKFSRKNAKSGTLAFNSNLRRSNLEAEDLKKVKQFTVRFLEAETKEEIGSVTNTEKIEAKIKQGVYFLELNNQPIGMARFIGKTNHYAEITSVYIEKPFRNKGFGKALVGQMIEKALQEKKIPILVTSVDNLPAIKTYEAMGFEKEGVYAYEFLY